MTESKPRYHIDPEVIKASILEQMQAIHEAFDCGPREGEFTMQEYRLANPSSTDKRMAYDRAKKELEQAQSAGLVARRVVGSKTYYRFTLPGT